MPLSHTDIFEDLTTIFRDVFDDESLILTPETTAKDIRGWDSYMHINLIVAAESFFNVKFKTAEIESLRNVGHFVDLIQAKLSK